MMPDGILLIDKPAGFTSFDVIAKLRGMTKTKKLGHAGTLDPMATGVLPVFSGRAAKAVDLLPDHDKTYIAKLMLGTTTDTQDITGQVTARRNHTVTAGEFSETLFSFMGKSRQTPPMYSAVRVNGQRLYALARAGREVERTPRDIVIYQLRVLEQNETSGVYSILVKCSRGAYIRTLCHDIGEKLGCGAVLTALRRVEACGFDIKDCVTLENAQALWEEDKLAALVKPVSSVFAKLPELVLNNRQASHFINGLKLGLSQFQDIPQAGTLRVTDQTGCFLGLAEPDALENELRIVKLFTLR